MHVANQTKLIIGIVFAIVGAFVLVQGRAGRGFNQRKQAGALFLLGGAVFVAIGLGYLDL